MRVDPADCHESFSNLALKELDLIVHRAHVLLASLGWNNDRRDHELTISFLTSQNSASLDLCGSVRMSRFEELSDDINWANDCAHASHGLERGCVTWSCLRSGYIRW